MVQVICEGGPHAGWTGTILHGSKITFPAEPKAEYKITARHDRFGRRIAVPVQPQQ